VVNALKSSVVAVVLALASAGCSLILNPENCATSADCLKGGVCTDGVCVGGQGQQVGMDAAGGADPADVAGGADASGGAPPDAAVDAMVDAASDAAADAMPTNEPPTCAIVSPAREDEGLVLAADRVNLTVQVADPDTAPSALTVSVNGELVMLDANASATVEVRLDEGDNFIRVDARDPQGNTCMDRRRVVRDQMGPTLEVLDTTEAPVPDSSTLGATPLEVMVRAADPHEVQAIAATARGVDVRDIALLPDGRTRVRFILQDGMNALEVRATDRLGNVSRRTFDVFFDGVDPSVVIDSPMPGDRLAVQRVTVRGVARDNQDVRAVTIEGTVTHDAGRPVGPATRTTPARDGTWTLANVALAEGNNTIEVCATDAVARSTCARTSVRVLAGAPGVVITTPDPAAVAVIGSQDVRVEGTATESTLSVLVGVGFNVSPADLAANGTWSATVRLPSQGEYVIGAQPVGLDDIVGQTQTVRVLFDDTAPQVRISQPTLNFCTSAATLRVEGDVTDLETSISAVRVNGVVAPVLANNRFRLDPAVQAGVGQVVTVEAENAAGLVGRATQTYSVDRSGPRLTLELAEGAFVAADAGGFVMIRGAVLDAECGLSGDPLRVAGSPALLLPDGTFTARRVLAPGQSVVPVVATDVVGNATRIDRTLTVDAAPPVIDNVTPAADAFTSLGTFDVSARVTDAEAGVADVTIGGVSVQPAAGIYRRRVGLVQGANAVEITATDRVGLVSRVVVRINRDSASPTVVITSPVPGQDVPDVLTVRGTVTDGPSGSGVAEVRLGAVVAQVDPNGTWVATGVRFATGGQHTVTVTAADNAGNFSSPATVSVDVLDFGVEAGADVGLIGASQTAWVGLVDANDDARLDIVALSGSANGASVLFLQRANGTFDAVSAAAAGLPVGVPVLDAAVGDVNADGFADLVLAGGVGATGVRFGTGFGGFTTIDGIGVPADVASTGVALGDVNRDGRLDFALLAGARSAVYLGNFGGTFTETAPGGAVGLDGLSLIERGLLMDLNKDGVQDLVGVTALGSAGWQGLSDAAEAGRFQTYAAAGLAYPNVGATTLLPLDADRDGDLDIITLGPNLAGVNRVTLVGNTATAISREAFGLNGLSDELGAVGADFDGDARDDVVTLGLSGLRYFGGADGGFTLRNRVALGLPALEGLAAAHAADIDADGDVDLLVAGVGGVTWVRSNATTKNRATYTFARVEAVRGRNAEPPFDAVGVVVIQDRAVNPVPSRALVHPAVGPLVMTYAGAPSASVTLRWIDKVAMPGNDTIIIPVLPPQAAGAAPLRQNAPE